MSDDDAPLCSLAKKAPSFDDDTPLASLANDKKAKAAKPGGVPGGTKPASKPSNVGKGTGKGKKRPKSDSSSDSSSSDSSSSSVRRKRRPKKALSNLSQKKKLIDRSGTTEEFEDGGGAVKKRDRSTKEQVVADLLCRWWYALPDWPPQDEAYYAPKLADKKLRKVEVQEWEWVSEVNEEGCKKVYELKQFKGIFRDAQGNLHDLRPMDTCPCYTTMIKKDNSALCDLLVLALEGQLKDLKSSKYNEEKFEMELKARLSRARNQAMQAKQMDGGARKR
jgi:hypothetical protein